MPDDRQPRKLTVEDVDLVIDENRFEFATTDELKPLEEIVGQPRALDALDLGLGIHQPSYNIYVAGASGMGKMAMIRRALADRVERMPTPLDWVYVNNFDEHDRPLAISLEPGQAGRLRHDMENLIERLSDELPKAFQREDLNREKQRVSQRFQDEARKLSLEFESLARDKGLAVEQMPMGQIALVPLRDDEPMTRQEVDQLPDEEREDIERRQREVATQVTRFIARQQEMNQELGAATKEIDRRFAAQHIEPLVSEIARRYANAKLNDWLQRMTEHMIDHIERFAEAEGGGQQQQVMEMLGVAPPEAEEKFREYQINVLVDNSGVEGAPVIIEESPNYKNLFGIIDRSYDRMGRATTDYTRIKAGSLLRASGGYLVFNLMDALIEPVVWKELKRAIKSGTLQIEDYEPLGLFSISALKPEPIPLKVKLVVVGNPLLYHLLYMFDEDFRDIFKVKAEFNPEMDRSADAGTTVGQLLQRLKHTDGEELHAFRSDGVAELIRSAARVVDDRRKMTTEFSRLADLAREANYWAKRDGAETVGRQHVLQAVEHKVYRSDLIAHKIRELIADGKLRITIKGSVVGQVNGLAIADLGDFAFARPARVTASIGVGASGIVNVERESRLSGRVYDKAMLILEGYLRNRYAGRQPIAFSASLAMEQSYGMIDGDSATAAELFCLLSALAEVPLRQDIAVTGSVNQHGEIQAVGGVNEKVEGFFDVCRELGLTGRQGVAVPASNVNNVVLRPDVVEAVRDGRFHVWAIEDLDEGLELLAGIPAGDPQREDTVHGRVSRRLRELAGVLKDQHAVSAERVLPGWPSFPEGRPDPRPPLPGRGS